MRTDDTKPPIYTGSVDVVGTDAGLFLGRIPAPEYWLSLISEAGLGPAEDEAKLS